MGQVPQGFCGSGEQVALVVLRVSGVQVALTTLRCSGEQEPHICEIVLSALMFQCGLADMGWSGCGLVMGTECYPVRN